MLRRKRYPWPGYATVQEAIRYLASACDGAIRRDGHGYGTDHTTLGHWLAQLPDHAWGPADLHAGQQLVHIYQQQLRRAGYDPHTILTGARPGRVPQKTILALRPGWHPDPAGLHTWRWWNGVRWTSCVR